MPRYTRSVLAALLAAALVVTSSGRAAQARELRVEPAFDVATIAAIGVFDAGAWELDRTWHGDPCPCLRTDVPAFDRVAIGRHDVRGAAVSDWLQYSSIVASPLLTFGTDPGNRRDGVVAGLVAIEAMSLAGSTTQLLKSAVHRPRPPGYEEGVSPPYDYHSLPSGHATGAFAAAASATTIFALRHPHSRATPWIAAAGFLVAGTTAALRVEAGRHFPSDVLAGAAIGTAAGIGVPLAHANLPATIAFTHDGVMVRVRFGSVR